jgi:ABC-type polysaccharide/polyol phosphate export permease
MRATSREILAGVWCRLFLDTLSPLISVCLLFFFFFWYPHSDQSIAWIASLFFSRVLLPFVLWLGTFLATTGTSYFTGVFGRLAIDLHCNTPLWEVSGVAFVNVKSREGLLQSI